MDGNLNRASSQAYNSGLLTAVGAEALYDTTVAINYSIDGIMYTKATVADGAAITTDANGDAFTALAADKTCWFAWCLNAAGTVAVVQGDVQDVDPDTDLPMIYPSLPSIPAGYVPFAIQRVQTAGTSSAWTFGTSNWNATGVTDVILNVGRMPDRPPTNATA